MKAEFWKSNELLKNIHEAIVNRRKCLAYTVADESLVFVPNRGLADEQLCYDLGYKVYESNHGGGIIVADLGDIDIAYFCDKRNDFHNKIGEALAEWLRSKGLNAVYEGNDVLVDDYKISGNGVIRHADSFFTVVHIGINTNLENIKQICTKPMSKVPKGLCDYGITAEDVVSWFLEFSQEWGG